MNHNHSQGVPSPPVMVWNLPGSSIVSWHLECDHTWCIPPLCKGITVDITRSGPVHIFSASVSHLGSWSLQCFLGTACLQTPRSLLWLGSLSTLELLSWKQESEPLFPRACTFISPSFYLYSINMGNPRWRRGGSMHFLFLPNIISEPRTLSVPLCPGGFSFCFLSRHILFYKGVRIL